MTPLKSEVLVDRLLAELHRRNTHFVTQEDAFSAEARTQVQGEIIGLRGALGIALGEAVRGGTADAMGARAYAQWAGRSEATAAVCTCSNCLTSRSDTQ